MKIISRDCFAEKASISSPFDCSAIDDVRYSIFLQPPFYFFCFTFLIFVGARLVNFVADCAALLKVAKIFSTLRQLFMPLISCSMRIDTFLKLFYSRFWGCRLVCNLLTFLTLARLSVFWGLFGALPGLFEIFFAFSTFLYLVYWTNYNRLWHQRFCKASAIIYDHSHPCAALS